MGITIGENTARRAQLANELNRWINILKEQYRPLKIIVFGSYANNTVREWSDVDMVIIKETDRRFLDRIDEVLTLLQPKVGIDLLVYTPEEFKDLTLKRRFFREEIISRGRVVYEG